MCACERCELFMLPRSRSEPLSTQEEDTIARLKRYIDRLNNGQMLNTVEVMDCLSLVAIYIDVAFNINYD